MVCFSQYWYNKETGESTWDTPAVMTQAQAQYAQATPSAQPMAKGTRSDSLWEQGGAGSKEEQLAKLLINGEKRLQARREKNALAAELVCFPFSCLAERYFSAGGRLICAGVHMFRV